MRYDYKPIRIIKSKEKATANSGKDVQQQELTLCWWDGKMQQPLWHTVW